MLASNQWDSVSLDAFVLPQVVGQDSSKSDRLKAAAYYGYAQSILFEQY